TARKARGRGPSRPRSQYQGKRIERGLGEPAEGRDLAANHGEERSLATRAVEGEHIVARRVLRIARAVVVERTHARERPDHVRRRQAGTEVIVDHAAKIADLVRRRRCLRRIAGKAPVGGPDQTEVALEWQRKHDPAIYGLEDVAAVMLEQPPHHDMAAFDQAKPARRRPKQPSLFHQAAPRSRAVDQKPRPRGTAPATHLQYKLPDL